MDIQNFIAEFKSTFVYELLSQTLTDEKLFEHAIDDDGVTWFKEQMRQMWSMWQAARATAVPKKRIELNCYQLMQATNFGAPDLTKWPKEINDDISFLLETQMVIEYKESDHSGAGFYCWYEDIPEEGSIFLEEMIKVEEPAND